MISDDISVGLAGLVFDECEAANKVHPLFSSNHEAYAVIKEEIEEAESDMKLMLTYLGHMWDAIKEDDDENTSSAETMIDAYAYHCAAECVQVAAMCKKMRMSNDGKQQTKGSEG